MANFIGLYYPFIHFKDEAWLKIIALYWDRVKRIVPADYPVNDSETVKRLAGELGLIQCLPSPDDEWPVRDAFVKILTTHASELRAKYGIEHRGLWSDDPITSKSAPDGSDKRLAYVHMEKIEEGLKDTLLETGLAEIGQARDERWVGMHPKIANVYMTALAEHMTSGRGWYPITDEALDQLAVSGFTMERLSRALLDEESLAEEQPTEQEIRMELANVCLETVIPKNIENIAVEKIIKLRKDHETEFAAFQEYLGEFQAEASNLTGITDWEALVEHLELHYEKTLKPSGDEVRKVFKLMKVDTATSVVNASFAVPSSIVGAITALRLSVDPLFGGIAGFALSVVPTIQKRRDEAREALKTPGAWLLRVEEGLKPKDFISRVRESARKFVLDV